MGWRIRYTGGPTGKKKQLVASSVFAPEGEWLFENGQVYDIHPIAARSLVSSQPESFERVFADDPLFAVAAVPAAPPRKVTRTERPDPKVLDAKTVRLRVLRDTVVPDREPGAVIELAQGTVVDTTAQMADAYVNLFPGSFEVETRPGLND